MDAMTVLFSDDDGKELAEAWQQAHADKSDTVFFRHYEIEIEYARQLLIHLAGMFIEAVMEYDDIERQIKREHGDDAELQGVRVGVRLDPDHVTVHTRN